MRAALVLVALTAVALSPSAARADTTASGLPLLGGQFSTSGGVNFAVPQGDVDAALVSAGRQALPSVLPAFQFRFGLMAYDVTLDLHIAGNEAGLSEQPGSAGSSHYSRGAIGVDLGYRLRLGSFLSVMPYVGIGSIGSTLCFAGHPDATSSTSRPLFEQIARNPGRNACLTASDVGLDAGLSLAWNIRLFPSKSQAQGLVSYLSIGPRAAYTLPLSGSQTWDPTPTTELQTAIPPFAGPLAPLGGVYVVIEAQIRFETE